MPCFPLKLTCHTPLLSPILFDRYSHFSSLESCVAALVFYLIPRILLSAVPSILPSFSNVYYYLLPNNSPCVGRCIMYSTHNLVSLPPLCNPQQQLVPFIFIAYLSACVLISSSFHSSSTFEIGLYCKFCKFSLLFILSYISSIFY